MEHVISEKHGGLTSLENLALAYSFCHRAKGTDLGSINPVTRQLTPFLNLRIQNWQEHFAFTGATFTGATIVPLTAAGRVTVIILQFNDVDRLIERERLLMLGLYPG